MNALEKSIEKKGVDRLWYELGLIARKDGREGWPDRQVFLRGGRHFWWEVKKLKGGRLTPAQARVLPQLDRNNDIVLLNPTLSELVCVAKALMAGDEAVARAFPSVFRVGYDV